MVITPKGARFNPSLRQLPKTQTDEDVKNWIHSRITSVATSIAEMNRGVREPDQNERPLCVLDVTSCQWRQQQMQVLIHESRGVCLTLC